MNNPHKFAKHVKIGNYFCWPREESIEIYQVRRDNVTQPQRAHYLDSIHNLVEAKEVVGKLNARTMTLQQFNDYVESKEKEMEEVRILEDHLAKTSWGFI